MTDTHLQEQIDGLNRKLDRVLESMEEQNRKREEFDDFMADAGIVVKDAFHHTVVALDKAQVDLDHSGIPILLIKLVQNLDTFRELVEMMESARDFMRDFSPIIHQAGLDAVHKMNELEQQGFFDIVRNLTSPEMIAGLARTSHALATVKMDDKADNRSLLALLKELNSPEVRRSLSYLLRIVKAMGEQGNRVTG